MSMDDIPVGVLFGVTAILVVVSVELGYRLALVARRKEHGEKESPVSAIAGSILGLLAFILAFTFGIVTDRFGARQDLVRQEANAIRTAFMRTDFLPAAERAEAALRLVDYADFRLAVPYNEDPAQIRTAMAGAEATQRRLWAMAVENARRDMNSDIGALYVESLNQMTELYELRVALGLQVRIPPGIWAVLFLLIVLGMLAVGYQSGIAESRRSRILLVLALAFSMVISMVASLDRPRCALIRVSQQPMEDVRAWMQQDFAARGRPVRTPGAGATSPTRTDTHRSVGTGDGG